MKNRKKNITPEKRNLLLKVYKILIFSAYSIVINVSTENLILLYIKHFWHFEEKLLIYYKFT